MATGYGWFLRQVEALAVGPREIAIVGPAGAARDALERVATAVPRPGTVVLVADDEHDDTIPLLRARRSIDGQPAAYVCRDLVCDAPTTTVQGLAAALGGSGR
jgi:uncharacterized protein